MATFEITKLSTTGHVKVRNVDTNKYYYYAGNRTTAKIVNNTVVIDPENDDTHVSINVVDSVDTIVYSGTSSPFTGTADNPVDHCDFLNTYCFFDFGDSGLTSVATASPLTGDGTLGNPVTFEDGSKSGQIPIWNGSQWIYSDLPSYTVNYLNNAVTLPFAGGFNLWGGGTNGNNIVGTFLYRNNNNNASILSPAEPGKGPILQLINTNGGRTHVSSTFGTGYFRITNTSSAKYYVRAKLRITQTAANGSCYFGFVQEPLNTPTGGFRLVIGANMIPVIQNGSTPITGVSIPYNLNQWYDILLEYQFIGGDQVLKVYIDGILVQTHTFTPAGAFDYQNCRLTMTNAGSTNAWIIQFEDFIQYAII